MQPKDLPVGYWIKKADDLLTKGINKIHLSFNIKRTEWQILHYINESNSISEEKLVFVMEPFADKSAVENILSDFEKEELSIKESNTFSITQKGHELHNSCFTQQQLFRQKTMSGITDEEYKITVITLQKMVENMLRADALIFPE